MGKKITCLPAQVYERIAAGEVVERPASVVKELVENALDAKASRIEVALEAAGTGLIQITDNGCGMHPADMVLAVKPHATSKIQVLSDLDRIASFGFRGEALASVCAVAEVSLYSQEPGQECFLYQVMDNRPVESEPVVVTMGSFLGANSGTRIEVRGLFSTYPARLKFLKSAGAEISHIRDWLTRLSVSFPSVAFTLKSADKVVFDLPAASSLHERIEAIFATEKGLLQIETLKKDFGKEITVELFWLKNSHFPNNKKCIQIVNQRALKDKLLQQAVSMALKQLLLPGQYPGLVLLLQVDPSLLDVNVHPAKTEVRFSNSSQIFAAIQSALKELIQRGPRSLMEPSDKSQKGLGGGHFEGLGGFLEDIGKKKSPEVQDFQVQSQGSRFDPLELASDLGGVTSEANFESDMPLEFSAQERDLSQKTVDEITQSEGVQKVDSSWRQQSFVNQTQFMDPVRFLGVLFGTYLLFEKVAQRKFFLIDQHAAHERILFEKEQKSQVQEGHSQLLLEPIAFFLPDFELSRLQWLPKNGFTVTYENEKLIFSGVPVSWISNGSQNSVDCGTRLQNLVQRLLDPYAQETSIAQDFWQQEGFAMRACKASVKAQDKLSPIEALALFERLFVCEHPMNCPHGRPVFFELGEQQLEKIFQRRPSSGTLWD